MCTLLLLDLESFDEELVDVLRLFVAEVGAEILHELDDAVLAEILIGCLFESVVGRHVSYIYYLLFTIYYNCLYRFITLWI